MPRGARLATRLSLALALSASRSLLAGQSIRRRWFGRVGRVLFPPRQLPLQIRNLLLGVSYLLLAFRYSPPEVFVLSKQPLIFPI